MHNSGEGGATRHRGPGAGLSPAAQPGCAGACGATFSTPFTMAFQPIVDITEQRIVAHEALVRGPGGESAASILAAVTPDTLYAFDQACRTKAIELAVRLGLPARLNINFLPNAVYEPLACIQATLAAAHRSGLALDRLTFEMVETEDVAAPGHLRRIVETYRQIGFRIALDDYGTGHSGLLRLSELRPDSIKVDRQLVAGISEVRMHQAMMRAVLGFCEEVGIEAIFEGVETEAEVRTLQALGARYMQGFHFARPALERMGTVAEITWPELHGTQG
ncbi:MAG TPA: EAL domain-containing protein [Acidisoma sp.]|uniref:EAL domain-containing protein n=1 Tax=Acidisoma sp. TaxID=1872115 RepID=UPI002C1D85AE|nr:EAL domain-containing protein [Acidisoma sp.]HTI00519.1 EAL domain-containing protein [Acidisoma sp.]